jgi:sulfate-transporting ATPase
VVHGDRRAALTVEGLSVRFGGTYALKNVSLIANPGQVTGLIGPNGAGKTTLIDAVSGFVQPEAGRIMLGVERIDKLKIHARVASGLARSFQSLELFEDLTVWENLQVADDPQDRLAYLSGLVPIRGRPIGPGAGAAIAEFGLSDHLARLPTQLPHGQRRLLGIARAVAVLPSVLLLDEPAAGLDRIETAELSTLIRRMATEWGITVVVVEHDMDLVMGVCDRIIVLDRGQQIADGTPAEIRASPAVIQAYLGEDESVVEPAAVPPP